MSAVSTARTRRVNPRGEGSRLRGEIIAAASRLLADVRSRDGVTLRAIAREAGIAAPSIYKHFVDREEILDAVVGQTFLSLESACRAALDSPATGRARILALTRAYAAFAQAHPDQYRVLFERSGANVSADPHPYPEGVSLFQYFVDAFAQAAAEGDTDSRQHFRDAQALWAAIHGVLTLQPATPGFPWIARDDLLTHLVDITLTRGSSDRQQPNPTDVTGPGSRRSAAAPRRGGH